MWMAVTFNLAKKREKVKEANDNSEVFTEIPVNAVT